MKSCWDPLSLVYRFSFNLIQPYKKKKPLPEEKTTKTTNLSKHQTKPAVLCHPNNFYGDMISTHISPTGWVHCRRKGPHRFVVVSSRKKQQTNTNLWVSIVNNLRKHLRQNPFNHLHQGFSGSHLFPLPQKTDSPCVLACTHATNPRPLGGGKVHARRHGGMAEFWSSQNAGMVLLDKDQHLELHSLKLTVRTWKWAFPKGN